MELNRREFLKSSALTAASLVASGTIASAAFASESKSGSTSASASASASATSASAASASTSASASAAASAAPAGGLKDGKFIGQAMGHRNKLTVQINVVGGAIVAMSLLRCDDTIGIGATAAPMLMASINEEQNLDVDSISGATITSFAVKSALEAAITAAGGNPDDYHKGTAEIPAGTDETVDADVVVVGAGTAGLVAATRLLEAGKNVVVIEKLDIAGGSGSMTYSGIAGVNSELAQAWDLGRHEQGDLNFDVDARVAAMAQYNGLTVDDLPFMRGMYVYGAAVTDWMHSIGIGFCTMGTLYFQEPVLAPGPYMGGSGYAMQFLADRIGALGGAIDFATTMTELIQAEDGTVTGIKAQKADGSILTVNAKAVCMTTGGFAANPDMLAQYYPSYPYSDAVFACCKGSTGEGLQMVVDAGATVECMDRQLGAFNATTMDAAGTRFELAFLHYFAPGFMVNNNGDEFGEGNMSHSFMGLAVTDSANGGRFFHITDQAGAITLAKYDSWGNCTDYACLFDRGDIVRYDTVEAAAEALNLPDLRATFDAHNAAALTGEKDAFGRMCTYLNEDDGIWAVSCFPTFYLTTGGVKIDTTCHTLTEAGDAIPGLYCAGDICGSVEEKDGGHYGYGFDAALSYGYIMADTVLAEI